TLVTRPASARPSAGSDSVLTSRVRRRRVQNDGAWACPQRTHDRSELLGDLPLSLEEGVVVLLQLLKGLRPDLVLDDERLVGQAKLAESFGRLFGFSTRGFLPVPDLLVLAFQLREPELQVLVLGHQLVHRLHEVAHVT